MAVVVRFKRTGAPNKPRYRLVATEKSRGPKGKEIEILGVYNPKIDLKKNSINIERIKHWISKGAILSDRAFSVFKSYSKEKSTETVPPIAADVQV